MGSKANTGDARSAGRIKEPGHIEPGSRVIVAEDDAAFRFLLGEALREEGFEVLSAADGNEALELYRKNAEEVTLAILDVVMPEMDGISAATEMRKIDDRIFFLFISGYDYESLRELGITIEKIPHSDFLWKPFTFKDLISRIRMLGSPHQA